MAKNETKSTIFAQRMANVKKKIYNGVTRMQWMWQCERFFHVFTWFTVWSNSTYSFTSSNGMTDVQTVQSEPATKATDGMKNMCKMQSLMFCPFIISRLFARQMPESIH